MSTVPRSTSVVRSTPPVYVCSNAAEKLRTESYLTCSAAISSAMGGRAGWPWAGAGPGAQSASTARLRLTLEGAGLRGLCLGASLVSVGNLAVSHSTIPPLSALARYPPRMSRAATWALTSSPGSES